MNIAIIPARGGSKRIPQKNIKEFNGKPIIAYSIEAALKSSCFDRVVVSTDDNHIAYIAKQLGAEVPFIRPDAVSDDFATTIQVMQHAIGWFEEQGVQANLYCCIYATAPFLSDFYIKEGLKYFSDPAVDYVMSVTTFAYPIQRALELDINNNVLMCKPSHINTRSQDLEETYHDAAQFYWGRAEAFKSGKPIFSKSSKGIVLPRKLTQDIDTLEDWEFAEALYKVL